MTPSSTRTPVPGLGGDLCYLRSEGPAFSVDEERIADEARYDGKWVLRTNTTLPTKDVALAKKQLWMVEDLDAFRLDVDDLPLLPPPRDLLKDEGAEPFVRTRLSILAPR